MSASEKAAWLQLMVCVSAVALVASLFPWLGQGATAGFALLALTTVAAVFYRQRGQRVVVDERDQQIERRATSIAVSATWMGLIATLVIAAMWSAQSGEHAVSGRFLNWLIWGQFVACFSIKAVASIVLYRSQRYAA